jgi:hypothetical protein
MKPRTILEEVSPNGNVQAIVEHDDRVAYFYLCGAPETDFGLRSCWVRNLKPAPAELDVHGMKNGTPPMLPSQSCAHPEGAGPLNPEAMRIVWLEEGDGAALLENDVVLAIIPAWSGNGGFNGYARDCTVESPICWPLAPDNALHARIRRAQEYWSSWDAEVSPWEAVQDNQIAAYAKAIGNHEKYYAIDGGAWPPKALLRTQVTGGVAFTSVGLCLRPQPSVEMATEDPAPYRRIELGMGLASDMSPHFDKLAAYLSGQSSLPWTSFSWLGPGHTIPCDVLTGAGFVAVLLLYAPAGSPVVTLPAFRGDPVNLLWAVAITERERALAMESGSDALVELLARAGVGWLTRVRHSVV